MRKIVERDRREPRYGAGVEAHIDEGSRRYVTVTRDVSQSGLFFFVSTVPNRDTKLTAVLHTDEARPIVLQGIVRYTIPEIGAGIEVGGDPEELARYRAFVDRAALGHTIWKTIGELVRPPSERPVSTPRAPDRSDLLRTELVLIGDSCRAIQILFERFPGVAPGPHLPAELREKIREISRQPVGLRLHARDRLRMLHIGVLREHKGYVAVLPTGLFALSGAEEIAVSAGGERIFPQFSDEDLDLIRRDIGVRVPQGFAVPLPRRVRGTATDSLPAFPVEHLAVLSFKEWTRFEGHAPEALEVLLDHLDAETRLYQVGNKQRTVRLLRSVPVFVRDQSFADGRACALMHDGKRMCALFGLDTGAPEIRPLTSNDEVKVRVDVTAKSPAQYPRS